MPLASPSRLGNSETTTIAPTPITMRVRSVRRSAARERTATAAAQPKPSAIAGATAPNTHSAETDLDAAMIQSLPAHPLGEAHFLQRLDRSLLKHARAHARLNIVAASRLDDHRGNAAHIQQM
jgi:hypothetical protein